MSYAVMQPYLFPYIGYYQLVQSVDKFVFYDDVNYIKRGFSNRNKILISQESKRFTLPVKNASQNRPFNQHYFQDDSSKIIRMISESYKKAPFFHDVFPIIKSVLENKERNVANISSKSVLEVFSYLNIEREFYFSSDIDFARNNSAADNLISIGKALREYKYINSPGGKKLYDKDYFSLNGMDLSFIEMKEISYSQDRGKFVPNLSIIDVLMWNSKSDIKLLLGKYRLV